MLCVALDARPVRWLPAAEKSSQKNNAAPSRDGRQHVPREVVTREASPPLEVCNIPFPGEGAPQTTFLLWDKRKGEDAARLSEESLGALSKINILEDLLLWNLRVTKKRPSCMHAERPPQAREGPSLHASGTYTHHAGMAFAWKLFMDRKAGREMPPGGRKFARDMKHNRRTPNAATHHSVPPR